LQINPEAQALPANPSQTSHSLAVMPGTTQTPLWQVPEAPEDVEQAVLLALFTAWQA
jgi:hypothetical protein